MKISSFGIIFILSILISCTAKKPVEENSTPIEEITGPIVNIDSVCLGTKEFKENCFKQEQACYFKISGKGDWTEVNNIIKLAALDFIDSTRVHTECSNEKNAPAIMGWAHTYYEILESHQGIVSVVLYQTNGHVGGDSYRPYATVFNIDPKNMGWIPNEELLKNVNREVLNKAIYNYFKSMFPAEAEKHIGEEFLSDKVDINDLNYGIRNDSLILVIPALPSDHPGHDVHLVPVKLVE
jgi:hypothetical protein